MAERPPYKIIPGTPEEMARAANLMFQDLYNRSTLRQRGRTGAITPADVDTSVPMATPTNISLITGYDIATPEEFDTYIEASCDSISNAKQYHWVIRKDGKDVGEEFSSSEPQRRFSGLIKGVRYFIKVAVDNGLGFWSNFSNEIEMITTGDYVGPAAPTSVTSSVSENKITLIWVDPPDNDLLFIECWGSETNNRGNVGYPPTTAKLIQTVKVGTKRLEYAGSYGSTVYHWLVGKDSSGNPGGWSHGQTSGVAVTTGIYGYSQYIEANTTLTAGVSYLWVDQLTICNGVTLTVEDDAILGNAVMMII